MKSEKQKNMGFKHLKNAYQSGWNNSSEQFETTKGTDQSYRKSYKGSEIKVS